MSKTSKRHFTVVIQNKEHGLYISSTPSSAAKKRLANSVRQIKRKKLNFIFVRLHVFPKRRLMVLILDI